MSFENSRNGNQGALVLVGFGGMAMELVGYWQAEMTATENTFSLNPTNGFATGSLAYIDDIDRTQHSARFEIACRGSINDFLPAEYESLLITVGKPVTRAMLWARLKERSSRFATYIHPTAIVSPTAELGAGVIVGPLAIVNAGATVGDNTLINCFASVSHGAVIGAHSVLSPYACVLGDAKIGTECLLGTKATVFPQVTVGDRCIIDSHSFAKMDVPDGHIVRCRTEYQVIRNRLVRRT